MTIRTRRALPPFTPSALGTDELAAATVGRAAVIDTLAERITSAARDGSRPHTLLVAPRGGGKTHVLRVAVGRALATDASTLVLPVLIPESSLAIGSYLDLLTEMARRIGADVEVAARALRGARDQVGIEDAITAAAAGRMILLGLENTDRVFDRIGEAGQGNLRAWVETSTDILLLATSPTLFPGVSSRTMPWYGSFIVERLPDLDLTDCATLFATAAQRVGADEVARYAATDDGLQRLSQIYDAIGGSPRLWHVLARTADVPALRAVTPAVDAVLDQLVGHYQQRLWELPAGEQRLVVELARGQGARTVGDLADAVGVSNQSAAAALGRLTDAHWVTSSKSSDGDRRTSWYDVVDPLLRRVVQYRDH